jgi:hypothetical protein
LLSFGSLPSYDPSRVAQALFGPDTSRLTAQASGPGVVSNFWQFALNGSADTVTARFDLAPASPASAADGALALYDGAGNVLTTADADPVAGHPGFESLSATLRARQVYVLGVFFRASAAADSFTVDATTGPQVVQPAIALDLASGRAATTADTFLTPATVNYYPLNLLDAGASGTVTVTPTGLGVNAAATLFRRDRAADPWQPVAGGSGTAAFSLTVTPPAGRSLTDAQYLLAVAPQGFNTAARSYTLDVQAPLLAPASVMSATATDLLTPAPAAPGRTQVAQDGTLAAGGQALFRFRAPSDGTATLTVQTIPVVSFAPVISVYDAGGTRLLAVTSSTAPGVVSLPLPVRSGVVYVVGVSDVSNRRGGAFGLIVQAPYTPTDPRLNALTGNASVTLQPVSVGPSQGAGFYRLNPVPGAQVLVVGVVPGGGASPIAAKVVLVGPDLAPVTAQVGAGQSLFLPMNISGHVGPFDLYVSGTQGSDPATLQIGQLRIPQTLNLTTLQPAELGIDGQLAQNQAAGAFGSVNGLQFYQLPRQSGSWNVSVQGDGTAQPLLALYQEQGSLLRLVDFQAPAGQVARLADALSANQIAGVAAFALGFGGMGTNHFQVTTPPVVGVGVGMVPDLSTNPPVQSVLSIRNVTLEHDYQQQLWQTILPFNLSSLPQLTLSPAASAPQFQARVSVYGNRTPIVVNQMNSPGRPLMITLSGAIENLRGQTILIRVEPVAGQLLGSGIYSLSMTVPTSDPVPFEVRETSWQFGNSGAGKFPQTFPIDVVQNQFGHGEAMGQFTSSQPYHSGAGDAFNPGALQVFRFWAINPGPVAVKTVLDPTTPTLNTDLRVYKAAFDHSTHAVMGLQQIDNVGPNLDWFAADRSRIDAQSYINDFDLLKYDAPEDPYGTGGNLYYVVVKNQEATQGRFKLVVDTASMPLLGSDHASGSGYCNDYCQATKGQVSYISPTAGGQVLLNAHLGDYPGLVGYFLVQLPAYHNGTFEVSSLAVAADGSPSWGSGWSFALFDAAGRQLPGNVQDRVVHIPFYGDVPYTQGTFTVPDGPQMVFLRTRAASVGTRLRISAGLRSNSLTPPPATFTGPAAMLRTNPQGDGTLGDSVSSQGQVKTYAFQAAAGPLTIRVTPDVVGSVALTWGVYANGNLIAWNQTGSDPASTTATVLLPHMRQPLSSSDYPYDEFYRSVANPAYPYDAYAHVPLENVVVYVQAANAPQAGGRFTIAVQTAAVVTQSNLATGEPVNTAGDLFAARLDPTAVRPMRNDDLPINPLTASGSRLGASGLQWSRLVVPAGVTGSVHLTVTATASGSTDPVRYDLYSIAFDAAHSFSGQLVASGDGRFVSGSATFDLPPSLRDGTSYYLRVGNATDAAAGVDISASVSPLAKDRPGYDLITHIICQAIWPSCRQYSPPIMLTAANPSPDGHFTRTTSATVSSQPLSSTAFWVDAGGQAHFDVHISAYVAPYIALFRGSPDAEYIQITLNLVDFVNDAGTANFRDYSLDASLDPGMYVLEVIASTGAGTRADVTVNASLPAYIPEEVVLDPKEGKSLANLRAANTIGSTLAALRDPNLMEQYRTRFYHVVAPSGSRPGLTVQASHPSDSSAFPLGGDSAHFAIWQASSGGYTEVGYTGRDLIPPGTSNATAGRAQTSDSSPGQSFWIALNRSNLFGKAVVEVTYEVPGAATPDWVVDPIRLLPNNGQTRVEITVHNNGYAVAPLTTAWLQFTDGSLDSDHQLSPVVSNEDALAPFASRTYVLPPWHPLTPNDTVTYTTNHDRIRGGHAILTELNDLNDSQTVALNIVDRMRPTVCLGLADRNMVAGGNVDAPVWGRYIAPSPNGSIAHVITDLVITASEPSSSTATDCEPSSSTNVSLYQLEIHSPFPPVLSVSATGGHASYTVHNFDFGRLPPTSPTNPNQLRVIAIDQYGLRSDESAGGSKTILVVPYPNWLLPNGTRDTAPSSITFDAAHHWYNLRYHNALVNEQASVDQLLYGDPPRNHLPLIGGANNQMLVEITGTATASLDPSALVTPPQFSFHVHLEVIGLTLFDHQFTVGGFGTPPHPESADHWYDHIHVNVNLQINSRTLELGPTSLGSITFLLQDLDLLPHDDDDDPLPHIPEIPLFAYGIPGVASIQASLQLDYSLTLSAGLTLGVDSSGTVGFLAPTFISTTITLSATLAGEIQILGFDLAKLSGSFRFPLTLSYGLPKPPDPPPPPHLVPPDRFFNEARFGGSLGLDVELAAKIVEIQIWSHTFHTGLNITFGDMIDLGTGPGPSPGPSETAQTRGGNDLVGPLHLEPSPNLVIDPASGNALYVQVVNNPPAGGSTRGNLAFDRRSSGSWSALTTVPETSHVTNPVLALTHDRPGTPAVVVYNALDSAGDPANLTMNQYLTGQNLRWRYYDGSGWGGEQTLAADGRNHANPVLAFNQSGQGVLAWVRNTNPNPVDATGRFDRSANEIMVSIWDPRNHLWMPSSPLTTNTVSDTHPAVFAGADGKLYVVWLQDTATGNQVMFSVYNGTAWSAPAILPITGLAAGGSFNEVAIGSEGPDRLNVLLNYSRALPDGTVEQRLYSRPSTVAGFAAPAALELVSDQGMFSHLRTLQAPDGGLVAYWQQSGGATNEVFASRIGPAGATWSRPAPLTADNPRLPGSNLPTGTNLPFAPSVALDSDGRFQVVYEVVAAPGANPSPPRPDLAVGNPVSGAEVGTSSVRYLPQLSFAQPLVFLNHNPQSAPVATSGTQVTAVAQLLNTGPAGDQVYLDYFDGIPGSGSEILLGSETIYLAAGQTFNITHAFLVRPGKHFYAIRATARSGQEVLGATGHVTGATLSGVADVTVSWVKLSNPTPRTGETVTVTADIANLSDLAVGSFAVGLYQGNPYLPVVPVTLLGTQTIAGLTPFGHAQVSFPWTVPAAGGDLMLTVRADLGHVLMEATRENNDGYAVVSARPDAAIAPVQGQQPVRAVLLNYSGVNNVSVSVDVRNLGQADLTNVPVQLLWSLDDGTFRPAGSAVIPFLPAGAGQTLTFLVTGLAGQNRYRAIVDPGNTLPDRDRSNNLAEAVLFLQGLPDLRFGPVTLAPAGSGPDVVLTVALNNQGIAAAEAVQLEAFVVPDPLTHVPSPQEAITNGRLVGQAVIDRLDPLNGAQVTIRFDGTGLAGQYLCVILDRLDKILMIDHQHNAVCFGLPAAPSGVSAVADSDTAIRLSWTNSATQVDGIRIFRSTDGGASFALLATLAANVTTYTDDKLAPGMYTYRLQTFSGLINSTYSNVASTALPRPAVRFLVSPSTGAVTAGAAFSITVAALAADGKPAASYRGTVHFTTTDGQAILPGDYTFTAADNGVHTFTVTLKTAGSQTVTVQDTTTGSLTGSATVAVTPALVASLVVANFPVTITAGVAGAVVVTARDAYGNVATGYTGKVHFTSSDAQAALPADYTFTAADNGIHTFSAVLVTVGPQSLIATDTATSGLSGSQAGIAVTPAPADHFDLGAPGGSIAGTAFDLTVIARDPYGNIDTNYQGTVTFSSSDGRAVLPADYLFSAGDNGVHTFTGGVTLFLAGNQTVTASDATSGISGGASLVITPAALDHFQFDAPTQVTSGDVFDVTVTALDVYGNVVTGYTGTVHFDSTDGDPGAVVPSDYSFTADDAGVHTFAGSVRLISPGDQLITVTDLDSGIMAAVVIIVAPPSGSPTTPGRSGKLRVGVLPGMTSSPLALTGGNGSGGKTGLVRLNRETLDGFFAVVDGKEFDLVHHYRDEDIGHDRVQSPWPTRDQVLGDMEEILGKGVLRGDLDDPWL